MSCENIRKKLLELGTDALTNAELLELVIQQKLPHCHRLSELFIADFHRLSQQFGINAATYCQLQACLELQRRYLQETVSQQQPLLHSQAVKAFLITSLRHFEQEIFACLFLDNQHRLIRFEKLFTGSLRETNIHPREVAKRALCHNAAALIAVHNHPSGVPNPSLADQMATKRLHKALALIEVQLLDHIIVGGNETYSFAEAGLI
jgi:DNA repair protein RadC